MKSIIVLGGLLLLAVPSCRAAPRGDPGPGLPQRRRRLQMNSGASGDTSFTPDNLLPNQCYICTPDNKIRPEALTLQYFGGVGQISGFQVRICTSDLCGSTD